MTPSEQCKQAGLKSLAELYELSPVPRSTLLDWAKNRPERFKMAIDAAMWNKARNKR